MEQSLILEHLKEKLGCERKQDHFQLKSSKGTDRAFSLLLVPFSSLLFTFMWLMLRDPMG